MEVSVVRQSHKFSVLGVMLDALIHEGQKDAQRPWLRQTTGGLLVAFVLAAIVGGAIVDFLGG
jgi:hypothetical protein